MAYEKEILGTYITYTPYWDKVQNYQKIVHNFIFCKAKIIMDRKGRNMAFITVSDGNNEIDGVMFASSYNKYSHTIKILISNTDRGCVLIRAALFLYAKEAVSLDLWKIRGDTS